MKDRLNVEVPALTEPAVGAVGAWYPGGSWIGQQWRLDSPTFRAGYYRNMRVVNVLFGPDGEALYELAFLDRGNRGDAGYNDPSTWTDTGEEHVVRPTSRIERREAWDRDAGAVVEKDVEVRYLSFLYQ